MIGIDGGTHVGQLVGDPREVEHFIRCPVCGGWIDCRDLAQVFESAGLLYFACPLYPGVDGRSRCDRPPWKRHRSWPGSAVTRQGLPARPGRKRGRPSPHRGRVARPPSRGGPLTRTQRARDPTLRAATTRNEGEPFEVGPLSVRVIGYHSLAAWFQTREYCIVEIGSGVGINWQQ
jgi:hypothetical protein